MEVATLLSVNDTYRLTDNKNLEQIRLKQGWQHPLVAKPSSILAKHQFIH